MAVDWLKLKKKSSIPKLQGWWNCSLV